MKLSKLAQWTIKQSLGSKRGDAVIMLLAGPVGSILDMALSGRVSDAFARLDEAFNALKDAIDLLSRTDM